MSYQLDVQEHMQYLHVTMSGANTPDTFLRALNNIREICDQKNCWKILIEDKLEGESLDGLDILTIANEEIPKAVGLYEAIAYVDKNRQFDRADFGETVAVNRGIPLMVFESVTEAKDWIFARPQNNARDRNGGTSPPP